ncbi:MAG TPA: IS1634 family transposase [Acidobacteriaceae bacterium]|nr:IS1634 family transposase [Acidobacteriaceae bacterium]
MFIRQTATRNKSTSETYVTYRLVASERSGRQVRQVTLLNLGRHFDLPQAEWAPLCARIDALLAGQPALLPQPPAIESLAQRYAARLIAIRGTAPVAGASANYAEIAPESLQLTRPRSVGVEHVGLAAMRWLGLDDVLHDLGFNDRQRAAVAGSVIGRMAAPGSEMATWRWLCQRSALGELLGVDFEALSPMQLYRISDRLVRHRDTIEDAVFHRLRDLFALPTRVTLYDLTNTYFEGTATGNPKAARGHSKEQRSDCPLVTLGLVLDDSGFVRRSRMFAGNVVEATTLQAMLESLAAPPGALVILDRGIATEATIAWLRQHKYRYLAVSRERARQFDPAQATETLTASGETIRLQRVLSEDGTEVRLYCHSAGRETKETAIAARLGQRFEAGLARLAAGLAKPRGQKDIARLHERIGRLNQQSRGASQHYEITLTADPTGTRAVALTWQKTPVEGSMLTHPGVYCLRSGETGWDAALLWQTYTMLTDLEAVFRGLKSELGLRPVFHHNERRTEGHLFITVLAYQIVQAIRCRLKQRGRTMSWTGLREILSVQQRVTATFRRRDGGILHVRKATAAEPALHEIYRDLALDPTPGGVQRYPA